LSTFGSLIVWTEPSQVGSRVGRWRHGGDIIFGVPVYVPFWMWSGVMSPKAINL